MDIEQIKEIQDIQDKIDKERDKIREDKGQELSGKDTPTPPDIILYYDI